MSRRVEFPVAGSVATEREAERAVRAENLYPVVVAIRNDDSFVPVDSDTARPFKLALAGTTLSERSDVFAFAVVYLENDEG